MLTAVEANNLDRPNPANANQAGSPPGFEARYNISGLAALLEAAFNNGACMTGESVWRQDRVKALFATLVGGWGLFVLGFLAAGTEWAQLLLALLGIGSLGCVLGLFGRGGWPLVGAVILGATGWTVTLYGSYCAHLLGWRELQESDFGSDDLHGHLYVWAPVILAPYLLLIPMTLSLAGYRIGMAIRTRRNQRAGEQGQG